MAPKAKSFILPVTLWNDEEVHVIANETECINDIKAKIAVKAKVNAAVILVKNANAGILHAYAGASTLASLGIRKGSKVRASTFTARLEDGTMVSPEELANCVAQFEGTVPDIGKIGAVAVKFGEPVQTEAETETEHATLAAAMNSQSSGDVAEAMRVVCMEGFFKICFLFQKFPGSGFPHFQNCPVSAYRRTILEIESD